MEMKVEVKRGEKRLESEEPNGGDSCSSDNSVTSHVGGLEVENCFEKGAAVRRKGKVSSCGRLASRCTRLEQRGG